MNAPFPRAARAGAATRLRDGTRASYHKQAHMSVTNPSRRRKFLSSLMLPPRDPSQRRHARGLPEAGARVCHDFVTQTSILSSLVSKRTDV
jgi:hypothetical protein